MSSHPPPPVVGDWRGKTLATIHPQSPPASSAVLRARRGPAGGPLEVLVTLSSHSHPVLRPSCPLLGGGCSQGWGSRLGPSLALPLPLALIRVPVSPGLSCPPQFLCALPSLPCPVPTPWLSHSLHVSITLLMSPAHLPSPALPEAAPFSGCPWCANKNQGRALQRFMFIDS